eukprot:6725187-Heterocapsa_arctica.AAC.1
MPQVKPQKKKPDVDIANGYEPPPPPPPPPATGAAVNIGRRRDEEMEQPDASIRSARSSSSSSQQSRSAHGDKAGSWRRSVAPLDWLASARKPAVKRWKSPAATDQNTDKKVKHTTKDDRVPPHQGGATGSGEGINRHDAETGDASRSCPSLPTTTTTRTATTRRSTRSSAC